MKIDSFLYQQTNETKNHLRYLLLKDKDIRRFSPESLERLFVDLCRQL